MSNYPPGVTGNEPEITGEWPDEDELDAAEQAREDAAIAAWEALREDRR